MTQLCLNCNKTFNPKRITARYCSMACRKSHNRNNSVTKEQVSVPHVTLKDDNPVTLTHTDNLFKQDAITRQLGNYYIFGNEVYNRTCVRCSKKFKTTLSMLHACTPDCHIKVIGMLTGDRTAQ